MAARDAVAVTPDTNNDLPRKPAIGFYVGGTGTLVVTTEAGNDVTFSAIPVGTIIPIRANRVKATSTATLIIAFYSA